jgi:drug/metabolite transporter (DMT)-like permease
VSSTTQVIMACVLQVVVTPFFPWHAPDLRWPVVLSVLLLGAIGTGVAYLIYFRLITDIGAANASAVNYLVPVTAVVVSLITLNEAISWNMIAGTLIVLASLALAENRVHLQKAPALRRVG